VCNFLKDRNLIWEFHHTVEQIATSHVNLYWNHFSFNFTLLVTLFEYECVPKFWIFPVLHTICSVDVCIFDNAHTHTNSLSINIWGLALLFLVFLSHSSLYCTQTSLPHLYIQCRFTKTRILVFMASKLRFVSSQISPNPVPFLPI